jgi:hypothetical protein
MTELINNQLILTLQDYLILLLKAQYRTGELELDIECILVMLVDMVYIILHKLNVVGQIQVDPLAQGLMEQIVVHTRTLFFGEQEIVVLEFILIEMVLGKYGLRINPLLYYLNHLRSNARIKFKTTLSAWFFLGLQ